MQPWLHHNLACALAAVDRVDEAIVSIRQTIQLDPGFVLAHVNLGHWMRETGRIDQAERSYRRALKLDPGNELAQRFLAQILRERAVSTLKRNE